MNLDGRAGYGKVASGNPLQSFWPAAKSHARTWIDDPNILDSELNLLLGFLCGTAHRVFWRHDFNDDERRMRKDVLSWSA